jgi:hypothetical protein
VADGTLFEQRGIPAAAVITSAFTHTADVMARQRGFPNYRCAVITHPISSLGPEEVKQRAREALPTVLALLGLTEAQDVAAGS